MESRNNYVIMFTVDWHGLSTNCMFLTKIINQLVALIR